MSEALLRTDAIQKRVADPGRSAWLSANAGTGKTFVLVRRVIRQLLSGSPPASIVCITFTKAAAAEMSSRLLDLLSSWSLASDNELRAALRELTNDEPSDDELRTARKLFARALETPGGLKIQTIHSFCGSILARFPAEAGLPLGFKPLEDDEAAAIRRQATADVASFAAKTKELSASLDRLTSHLQGEDEAGGGFTASLEDCLRDYLFRTRDLAKLEGRNLAEMLEQALQSEAEAVEDVLRSFERYPDAVFLTEVTEGFSVGGARAKKLAQKIQDQVDAPAIDRLLSPAIYTSSGTPASTRPFDRKSKASVHELEKRWQRYCEHIAAHRDRLFLARCHQDNRDFIALAVLAGQLYQRGKATRNGLDYDDLIERTLRLLRDTDQAWVRFKLDEGIDHVLLDEAQDTSSAQWDLFRELVAEITDTDEDAAGASRARSLFAVGDPKQSIYAFSGAEAALFTAQRDRLKNRLGKRLVADSLFLSFRTSQPVLDLVDAAFDRADFHEVAGGYTRHESRWNDRPGAVEIWPYLPEPEKTERSVWDREVDATPDDSIDRRLTQAIAEDIEARLSDKPALACVGGRRMIADDVMILFQRRGTRFREMLRALGERGIACAGTDRIAVASDVAVRDLIHLLRFASNTDDDLSLAVLLRSPLFDWSEQELFDLCCDRKTHLWRRLKETAAASGRLSDRAQIAVQRLEQALNAGTRKGPFSLLSTMLDCGHGETGRSRLQARLGEASFEAVDALLDEALRFEDADIRNVHGFLLHAERFRREIKREIAGDKEAGVRVMTVHGAKGLEAPIVYLADADYLKSSGDYWKREKLVPAELADGVQIPIFTPSKAAELPARVHALRDEADARRDEEYQRLLYVGATRAAEHLIICGGKASKDGVQTWHQRMMEAFERLAGGKPVRDLPKSWGESGRIYEKAGPGEVASLTPPPAFRPSPKPDWIGRMAPDEEAVEVIYPSLLPEDRIDPAEEREAAAVGTHLSDPRRFGLLVHHLLEYLPEVDPSRREEEAKKQAALFDPRRPGEEQDRAAEMACQLLADPMLQELFGPQGRAEVSIQGDDAGRLISGQIDRLLVTDEHVLCAEFKTTRWVPATDGDIPAAHARQVELYCSLLRRLYPGRRVEGLLIYTAAGRRFQIA